ncbi:MAG: ArsR family transcriptional regulator [Saprospiraceae bacterium]|nr:ArsR family transcriptional regulator [Saprospiraceae bacterium]
MLEALITSKTRLRLLHRFFISAQNQAYLRGLETELGESTNSIRVELNRLSRAKLLISESRGNRRYFKANTAHPFFDELHQIVLKEAGIPQIMAGLKSAPGNFQAFYLRGDLSKGLQSKKIDLILVGKSNFTTLNRYFSNAEKLKGRKIRFNLFSQRKDPELLQLLEEESPILLWESKR